MAVDVEKLVRELKDRQDIRDVVMTYCRGVDRLDRDLLESVYHPGALDDHGMFVGPCDKFIDWVLDYHHTNQQRTLHLISTHICELDGDVAHAESYYTVRLLNRAAPFYHAPVGRYIDRFERRHGRWAIAARVCTTDIFGEDLDPEGKNGDWIQAQTARDRTDPCFRRPLTVDPSRFTETPMMLARPFETNLIPDLG